MSARTRRWVFIVFLVAFGGAFVYLATAGPVLYSFIEPGVPTHEPTWSLLNPLRSRAPERAAEDLLRALRNGQASVVLPTLVHGDPMGPTVIVESEQKFRLTSWKLRGRSDDPGSVELLYHATRVDYPKDTRRPIRIRVDKPPGDSRWRVTSFSAVY